MMFLFINISLAETADTAVKSDELQMTTTSVNEVVSTNSEVSLTNNEVVTAHEESYSKLNSEIRNKKEEVPVTGFPLFYCQILSIKMRNSFGFKGI